MGRERGGGERKGKQVGEVLGDLVVLAVHASIARIRKVLFCTEVYSESLMGLKIRHGAASEFL